MLPDILQYTSKIHKVFAIYQRQSIFTIVLIFFVDYLNIVKQIYHKISKSNFTGIN